ncbi:MAG: imelysin family protein, partial [Pseudomonadota bacterium]
RLGPLASENRLERMLFWPDRRGRGLNQVRNVIRTNDVSAQDPISLARKSVAVQGLLALEFTLFGSGFEALKSNEGSDRCAYASAISVNIANIAAETKDLWINDGSMSISTLWRNPSETNPLFRDGREQLAALFKVVGEGLEIIVVQRLDPFLRDDFEKAKPKSALFWRSGNTVRSLAANIDGLEAIMGAAGLETLISQGDNRVLNSLFFEFKNAKASLSAIDKPPSQIAQVEADYNKLNYARIVVSSMNQILSGQLSPIFNLSSGFSSLDGD